MELPAAFPPTDFQVSLFCPFKPKILALSGSLLSQGPFPSPCHATSPLRHWTPRSPPPADSPGSAVLAPVPLPSRSVTVTWLFSRSLSAALGSPSQSNDAMAAISAPAPARASATPRQAQPHPAANGLPQRAGSRAAPTAAERRRQARGRRVDRGRRASGGKGRVQRGKRVCEGRRKLCERRRGAGELCASAGLLFRASRPPTPARCWKLGRGTVAVNSRLQLASVKPAASWDSEGQQSSQ